MLSFHKKVVRTNGDRQLILYGTQAHQLEMQIATAIAKGKSASHLRWHPFRQEWVCYAAHRQDRTFKPAKAFCPLCPTQSDENITEIPFRDFEVAVFDNRFPAFQLDHQTAPELPVITAPATGHCEVIVYSADHDASLGTLSQARRELMVQVWGDRYQALLAEESIQFVMPFENRGEAIGVTLHHPHGQIYGFSYVPTVVATMQQAFRDKLTLQQLRETIGQDYDIFSDSISAAFVPPFQRYPYEVWLTTHQFHAGPWTFSEAEIRSFAAALGKIARMYDRLFGQPMPYLMIFYAAPKGAETYFQFHVQFLPFLRTTNKLKYLAGCETGAGTFLSDMLPEETVKVLRQVASHDL